MMTAVEQRGQHRLLIRDDGGEGHDSAGEHQLWRNAHPANHTPRHCEERSDVAIHCPGPTTAKMDRHRLRLRDDGEHENQQ